MFFRFAQACARLNEVATKIQEVSRFRLSLLEHAPTCVQSKCGENAHHDYQAFRDHASEPTVSV